MARALGHMLQGGGGSSAGGPDRLSALPDCLLHIIMSSLKARQVVQTCVLSTRWRHLWRSVPCLDIDIIEFRTKAAAHAFSSSGNDNSCYSDDSTNSDSGNDQDKGEGRDEFEDFVVNLMLHCNIALLDSFRLDIDRGGEPLSSAALGSWAYSGRQATAWLRCAMKYCTPGPGHAISYQRQGLNLRPSSWRLRRLHLCDIPLDDRFAEHLSSLCHSLEDLELDHCTCEIRSIASNSLKNLVLRSCIWGGFLSDITSPTLKTLVIDGGSNEYHNLLAISAPMVVDLHLDVDVGGFCGGISMNEMPSLDRASIRLRSHKYSSSKNQYSSKLGGDQSKLLCSVSNAMSLELLSVGKMLLGKEPAFQEFQNLRNLLLGNCDLSDNFRTLRFFLRGSPNLEKVTLWHCKFRGDSHKLDKTSSCGCCRVLDFLRDENIGLEIIHKDGLVCRSADENFGLEIIHKDGLVCRSADENFGLEIIHKDGLVCRSVDELAHDLPDLKGTIDATADAATTTATEDSMPHSAGVGPGQGVRHRMTIDATADAATSVIAFACLFLFCVFCARG